MNEALLDAMALAEPLIKEFERGPSGDFAAQPYVCPAGKKTIGWGHVILPGERMPNPMDRDSAADLLGADILRVAESVDALVKVPTTPAMLAALIGFTFNLGINALRGSTLRGLLNAGDYAGAAEQFGRWNKGRDPKTGKQVIFPGLTKRRAAEKALFLSQGIPE